MKRRDLGAMPVEERERRIAIAVSKMTKRQSDIFLSARYDDTSYGELAKRHNITVGEVSEEFAKAFIIVRRCLHARFPHLAWPW